MPCTPLEELLTTAESGMLMQAHARTSSDKGCTAGATALLGKALGEALARTFLPSESGAAGNAKSKGKEQDF